MSVRKSSHGTIFLIVSSGSPRALIASSLRSTSKKPFCPMTRSLHPPMTACGHRVRFAATWREEFFEVPICLAERRLREGSMANAAQQMPEHIETTYKDAVDNIIFLKRQQWLATNYALLVYAAIFIISAHYFSRTDLARNWLGGLTIATFVIHWCMLHVFQRSIEKFRDRLG